MKLGRLIDALRVEDGGNGRGAMVPSDAGEHGEREVGALFYRAQEVTPGGLFVAVKGYAADGHDYIAQAVDRGAVAVVCERPVAAGAAMIPVSDTRRAMAALAAEFYGHPSRHMTMVGITGTNGKTTTSYLIESMLQAHGFSVGVIGTVNYRYGGKQFDNPVTTPESLDLQRILAGMRSAGTTHVVMEISSHALDLQRIHGCEVDVAVFTNLSQDHLDFHRDMDAYWASKQKLFTRYLRATAGKTAVRAVINADDTRGRALAAGLDMHCLTTGSDRRYDVWADTVHFDLDGTKARVHTPRGALDVQSGLAGRHNLENILNAIGVGIALDLPSPAMLAGIRALRNVPGRLERVPNHDGRRFIYVDYAHTPDALENVLQALRALTTARIICVFGCGGDRDRAKRPRMGAIAARLADLTIVTSDNPRTEPPDGIIAQILDGVSSTGLYRYTARELEEGFDARGVLVESDRRKAIALGIRACRPGDTVLIAGKGHEPYQIIGREKFPFDDRQVAKEALER
jgi:UDP-N-acetylmuramoyl-L-alanyl-D-glutamate--2,6-diaminopimelate ligase